MTTESNTDDVGTALRETLGEIANDLVGEEENESFLRRLFANAAGTFGDARELARELPKIRERLDAFDAAAIAEGEPRWPLKAVWLSYPETESGYAVIFFFHEGLLWSKSAIYHRAALGSA